MSDLVYRKRNGTSCVSGQLYETKLISLIAFRAKHDDEIEDFYLGSNVDGLGEFDDICFRFKLKSHDKPIAIFLQAKHRDQNRPLVITKSDLVRYFKSYMSVRSKFDVNSNDIFFKSAYQDVECAFVFYTNTRDELTKIRNETGYISDINKYISTGEGGFRLSFTDDDVNLLNESLRQETIVELAKIVTSIVRNTGLSYRTLMNNKLIQLYHVILSQNVFVFDEEEEADNNVDYGKARFNFDLFDAQSDDYQLLGNELLCEVLNDRKNYKGSTLTALNKSIIRIYFSDSFKLPGAFGNRDLTLRGDSAQREKRLSHLANTFVDLLKNSTTKTVDEQVFNNVSIDEDFPDKGFLRLNGGIAGAVGNLLIRDDKTGLLKFANGDTLTGDARTLFDKIDGEMNGLEGYRLDVNVNDFPKLTFECNERDKRIVVDFTNKLMIYTNQARESVVESILKAHIDTLQNTREKRIFQIKSDGIYTKYHDDMQKWWMNQKRAEYLTKTSTVFQNTIDSFISNPLLCVASEIHQNKYMKGNIKFDVDAVNTLQLDETFSKITIVIAEVIALTVSKVIQFIKENYITMDLNYISSLPVNDCNHLKRELVDVKDKIIIVTHKLCNFLKLNTEAKDILQTLTCMKLIIITNSESMTELRNCLGATDCLIVNDSSNLVDLTKESQEAILRDATIMFQGVQISLNLLINYRSYHCVKGNIMEAIMNGETIQIGEPLTNSRYEEIKDYYVSRRIASITAYEDCSIKILDIFPIYPSAVLLTAEPGMGKSSLLTHLSLNKKAKYPYDWIVRINLLDHSRYFHRWKENKVPIDILEALRFICVAFFNLKDEEVLILEENDYDIILKDCTIEAEDINFAINMFLSTYSHGRLIFVFDGFDEICPHYEDEIIQLILAIKNHYTCVHSIWVSTRTYSEILSRLQQVFEVTYELQPLNFMEQQQFINKYLKSKLDLNELNAKQIEKIDDFIKFMEGSHSWREDEDFSILYKCRSLPLHTVYLEAAQYFKDEIRCVFHLPNREKYEKAWDLNVHAMKTVRQYNGRRNDINDMLNFIATPLHLFMTIDYFQNEIKHVDTATSWDLNGNTYAMYEHFVETKLRKIRFEEKNQMDLCKPDVQFTFERDKKEFINVHKRLAAYAMFNDDVDKLFSETQLKDIRAIVDSINSGCEKTGVIYAVIYGIPRFVHLTFAEYFAVEYICDLLRSKQTDDELKSLWSFILNTVFFSYNMGVLNILDDKLIMDSELMGLIYETRSRRIIFDLLMKPSIGVVHTRDMYEVSRDLKVNSALEKAMSENLKNLTSLFLSTLEFADKDNIENLVIIITNTAAMLSAVIIKNWEFMHVVLNTVRELAPNEISQLFAMIPKSLIKFNESTSNEMIIVIMHRYVDEVVNDNHDFFVYTDA